MSTTSRRFPENEQSASCEAAEGSIVDKETDFEQYDEEEFECEDIT